MSGEHLEDASVQSDQTTQYPVVSFQMTTSGASRMQDLTQINELMTTLERRVGLLSVLRQALAVRDIMVRIGAENERPELRSFALVASSYGLPARKLGTVSLMGPVRMDYGDAIVAVREAAHQLSRYIETVYDEA